jgi:hypothetical protein
MAAHIWEDGDPSERASQRGDRQDPPDAQERRVNRHVGRAPVSVLSDDTYGKIIAGLVAVGRNGLTPPF